jgi:hypothetical protein
LIVPQTCHVETVDLPLRNNKYLQDQSYAHHQTFSI